MLYIEKFYKKSSTLTLQEKYIIIRTILLITIQCIMHFSNTTLQTANENIALKPKLNKIVT